MGSTRSWGRLNPLRDDSCQLFSRSILPHGVRLCGERNAVRWLHKPAKACFLKSATVPSSLCRAEQAVLGRPDERLLAGIEWLGRCFTVWA